MVHQALCHLALNSFVHSLEAVPADGAELPLVVDFRTGEAFEICYASVEDVGVGKTHCADGFFARLLDHLHLVGGEV